MNPVFVPGILLSPLLFLFNFWAELLQLFVILGITFKNRYLWNFLLQNLTESRWWSLLKSDYVFIDLLTDSGTGAMSDKQWAAIMEGDESYAGARSFYRLKDTIEMLTGLPYVLPSHQGRAAENVLFSSFVKEGDILPGNSHFDTTKGHIEYRKAVALDCTIKEASNTELEIPFKGNMDLEKLEEVLKTTPREKIPCVVLTVTNNTAGGQPVSMENIKGVSALCKKYGVHVGQEGRYRQHRRLRGFP